MPATRLPSRSLDVLRAIAVLCVLIDHVIVAQTGETRALWSLGRVGVLLFFFLTSLVLMASLERTGDTPRQFYLRRACRIYPLAIATVLAVTLLGLPTAVVRGAGTAMPLTATTLLANLTLTTNLVGTPNVIGPLWSLPLEVQMYAVLPLCYLVAQRGVRPVVRLLGLACALWLVQRSVPQLWRADMLGFAPVFLLGVLAFGWLRTHHVGDLAESRLTRGAHTIATYSYGIYLWHVPALAIAFLAPRGPVAQWGLFAALLFALPVAGYHLIERPGILLGQRLARARLPVFDRAH
jgi:Predicted acyltransferases